MDFTKGTRVVAISKSVGDPIEKSNVVRRAMERSQPFIYVTNIYTHYVILNKAYKVVLSCSDVATIGGGGDYFLPTDLIPYLEDNETFFDKLHSLGELEA